MQEKYKKLNDFQIEVTKEVPTPEPIKINYDRYFIENQIKTITEDRDKYIIQRNIELEECEGILREMNKLGIEKRGYDEEDIKEAEIIK